MTTYGGMGGGRKDTGKEDWRKLGGDDWRKGPGEDDGRKVYGGDSFKGDQFANLRGRYGRGSRGKTKEGEKKAKGEPDRINWPIYVIPLPHGPVTLQWNYTPFNHTVEAEELHAIAAYMENPHDGDTKAIPFVSHKPARGIVRSGVHISSFCLALKPKADKEDHFTVKFSTAAERDKGVGYDRRIYVDSRNRYDPSRPSRSFYRTPKADKDRTQKVYSGRSRWPVTKYYSVRRWAIISEAQANEEIEWYAGEMARKDRGIKEKQDKDKRGRDGGNRNNYYDVLSRQTECP
ncbi:MAG: hypothetical protein M1816_008129 [Peltula sp. TS41687]|nr:MAG: hypothetical protein M1816_008129 [Peltula sp. TS41687]